MEESGAQWEGEDRDSGEEREQEAQRDLTPGPAQLCGIPGPGALAETSGSGAFRLEPLGFQDCAGLPWAAHSRPELSWTEPD